MILHLHKLECKEMVLLSSRSKFQGESSSWCLSIGHFLNHLTFYHQPWYIDVHQQPSTVWPTWYWLTKKHLEVPRRMTHLSLCLKSSDKTFFHWCIFCLEAIKMVIFFFKFFASFLCSSFMMMPCSHVCPPWEIAMTIKLFEGWKQRMNTKVKEEKLMSGKNGHQCPQFEKYSFSLSLRCL